MNSLKTRLLPLAIASLAAVLPARGATDPRTSASTARQAVPQSALPAAQLAIAKLYGAGGMAGLEGYQSGVFLTGEPATVLTIDSTVLEGGAVTLVDAYGDRCEARLVGRDGPTGLALIECPEAYNPPATFAGDDPPTARRAQPVWALSNAFSIATGDEPVTVQRCHVAALAPMPTAADPSDYRPTLGAPEPGFPVLLLDAVTSNPGAGGGAVVDRSGVLLGVLGAECRSPTTGAWINYALPAASARAAVERIRQDAATPRPERTDELRRVRDTLAQVGLGLIPSVSRRTPAYVERVVPDSPASQAGCQPDDLIVAVDGVTVGAVEAAGAAVQRGVERNGAAELTVLRGDRLVTLTLEPEAP